MKPALLTLKRSLKIALLLFIGFGMQGATAAPEPKQAKTAKAAPPPAKPVVGQTKGTLVIIGGGLRGDNAVVWQRIVDLAGGKGAKIAVFGSASINPERSANITIGRLNQYGADAFFVPVAVNYPGNDYRKAADDPAIVQSVRSAAGVFFVGGDQGRITQALVRNDGSRTAVLDAVWQVYRGGGVVAGSSAGAAIMSTTMFHETKPVLDMLKMGITDGKEIAPGLGFVGDDVFIDQHLLVRGRFARMIPVMLKKGYQLGLGIDENTAMVVTADREVEVIGYSGALLIDLSNAMTEPGMQAFNVSNAAISYLDRGDKFNLATRVFTPAPDKTHGRLDPDNPELREAVFTNDILGRNAVLHLMGNLIDNAQQEAIGIAFGNQRDPLPELGFEFRFSKTLNSVGYASAESSAYSVLKLRLDIRPIQLRQPLYRYK
ncbi:cyanophycinase [Massilia horti]|uniref:Cyanophycinase n=1 Tax=Massilia horti TaxID=2562153 RepID=A0A4Y9T1P8_9BURK|nr:cyanophycinase [Massilia horti]TFW32920.1 cyanophycinase [Massilia horti]